MLGIFNRFFKIMSPGRFNIPLEGIIKLYNVYNVLLYFLYYNIFKNCKQT